MIPHSRRAIDTYTYRPLRINKSDELTAGKTVYAVAGSNILTYIVTKVSPATREVQICGLSGKSLPRDMSYEDFAVWAFPTAQIALEKAVAKVQDRISILHGRTRKTPVGDESLARNIALEKDLQQQLDMQVGGFWEDGTVSYRPLNPEQEKTV